MAHQSDRIYSLSKDKIRFLLLEGVHESAVETLNKAGYDNIERISGGLSEQDLREAVEGVHFLGIRSRTQITPVVLEKANRLNAIGCFCIGTNQVALDAAQTHGVPVFNAPYSNTRSVAELVLAEMIMLMRGIPQKNAAAHRGKWQKSARNSHEVRGKTLGVIGYGHIGSQLGILAESVGMNVIYHDIDAKLPLGNAEAASSMEALLQTADLVSLHVPETELTHRMIGQREIAAMRPGSYLLNLSRGTVVDIPALHKALKSGHLAGAAIDVYPQEPRTNDEEFISELREFDQCILTPHIGGSTQEAQENIGIEVASKLAHYSDNGSTMSAVNFPEVSLPDNAGTHRIMHIHRNEPGVLQKINSVFSDDRVNVAAQYLQTRDQIGYVVMDIEVDDAQPFLDALRAIESTIRCRVLY